MKIKSQFNKRPPVSHKAKPTDQGYGGRNNIGWNKLPWNKCKINNFQWIINEKCRRKMSPSLYLHIINFMHRMCKERTTRASQMKTGRIYKAIYCKNTVQPHWFSTLPSPRPTQVLQRYTKAYIVERRSLLVAVPTSHAPASVTSSSYLKWRPRRTSLTGQKKWKSSSAKSGE
jgi:hypothetical protein